ncbi:MAG: hypothetical protein ABFR47_00370 [Verrucomicrobiota bacterium]
MKATDGRISCLHQSVAIPFLAEGAESIRVCPWVKEGGNEGWADKRNFRKSAE